MFRYHGLPETIVYDREVRPGPRFLSTDAPKSIFEHAVDALRLTIRLRVGVPERPCEARELPMVEFALNNAVDASTGFTPFYLNGLRHPQVPLTLRGGTVASIVSGGEARKAFSSQVSEIERESLKRQLSSFRRQADANQPVRDAMASAQDKQKDYSDKKGRGNLNVFKQDELVVLDTKHRPLNLVSSVGSYKLKHRFIGPFAVLVRRGTAYTIDLPKSMATHPTFYAGRLKRDHDPLGPSPWTEESQGENAPPRNEVESSGQPELPVWKPVNGTQAGTHECHTKGVTVPNGKSLRKSHTRKPSGTNSPAAHKRASGHAPHGLERLSLDGGGSRNSAVNTPVELSSLTTQSVHILTEDLKGPWLASLWGRLTTRSQPKGDLGADGPRHSTGTPQSPDLKLRAQKEEAEMEPHIQTRVRAPPALLDRNGELHYHVERVVQERRRSGKRQLLVKWRSYPSPQNSWEPEDRLRVDCPKAVEI
ncbi:Pol protein [Phytophthora palmivora]|uniref:Pol protein n=1 Tax=Phytophthora palmivora TaxID=4796 RepID=A0A2P4YEN2_9STRA|nr:Pol protein [Phytophthora palmivora]